MIKYSKFYNKVKRIFRVCGKNGKSTQIKGKCLICSNVHHILKFHPSCSKPHTLQLRINEVCCPSNYGLRQRPTNY